MSSIITKKLIDNMQKKLEANDIEGNKTFPFMWSLVCVEYIYYNGDIGVKEIKKNWTDGKGDGGIDYIYYKENSDDLYLIQGKSEKNLSFKSIKTAVREISDTIKNFDAGLEEENNLDKKVIVSYKKAINDKRRENITIVIITDTKITEELRNRVMEWKMTDNNLTNFKLIIYGKEEIEEKAIVVMNGEKTVKKGILERADENILKYSNGSRSGIILNIKAKSLHDLYEIEADNELFGYNLRTKIKDNKKLKVDEDIKNTMSNPREKDNFWFYNNGITIGCEDYEIEENKLILKKFSIINGAQTTSIIGKEKITEETDFSLVCKVVKAPGSLDNGFIKQISKASNSQKQIEMRDIYANGVEQIQLQYRFYKNENHQLAISIKRGVKPPNYSSVKPWQKIENSKLGQIILSAYLQKPATARNNPNCIFSDSKIYNEIFGLKVVSNYNYNALYDIVRLNNYYERYRIRVTKEKEKRREEVKTIESRRKIQDEIGVLKNSGYTVISIITYLIKRKYFGLSKIHSINDEVWKKFINKKIDTDLSLNYKRGNYEENLEVLFNGILKILFELYEREVNDRFSSVNNPSNYFKRDNIYREKIIPAFDKLLEKDSENLIFKKLDMFDDNKNKEEV